MSLSIFPIGTFCRIINFCVKNDDKPPYAKYHLLHEFGKDEYSVNGLVTGSKLGKLLLHKKDDMLYFDISGKETSGKLMIRAEGFIPAGLQAVSRPLGFIKGMKPDCNTSGEQRYPDACIGVSFISKTATIGSPWRAHCDN